MTKILAWGLALWLAGAVEAPKAIGAHEPMAMAPSASPAFLPLLEQAEAEHAVGNYEESEELVKKLVEDELAAAEKVRLYVLSARLEQLFGRPHNAKAWLEKLARLEPGLAFDPVRDPPELIELWHEVRQATQAPSFEVQPPAALLNGVSIPN